MEAKNNTDPFLSEKDCDLLRKTILNGFTEDEQESFIRLSQRQLLDPFSKQIYATRRYVKDRQGNKVLTLVPVTSVMGLTAIAVRTGDYDGCEISWAGKDGVWRPEWLEDGFPAAAKCVVYHKKRSHPEVGIARWEGFVGQSYNKTANRWEVSDFWERMPDFMIGKVAKAQALRGAFPDQCSNLFISEELQGGISEADQVNDEIKITENRKKEEELLKKAAAQGIKVVESKPVKKPTPAEAAAPVPEPPMPPTPPVAAPPVQAAAAAPQEPPDDLDMGEPAQPPQPEASAEAEAGPPVESAKPWADHVIQGLKNPKFLGRKVGELTPAELTAIETGWIPKVRAVWDTVKQSQKEDAEAFEAAIAYAKMEKPWG